MRELGRGKIKKKKKVTRVESGLDRDIDRVINKIEISKFIHQRERQTHRQTEGVRTKEEEKSE